MLFEEIIAASSENHAKSINTLWKKQLLIVKADGAYGYHLNLRVSKIDGKDLLKRQRG
jgi:hypothetical protein